MAAYGIKLSCHATVGLWDLLRAFLEISLPCAIILVFFPSWIDFTMSESGITLCYSGEIFIFSSASLDLSSHWFIFSTSGQTADIWFCWFAFPLLYFHANIFVWCCLKAAYICFLLAVSPGSHLEDFGSLFNGISLTKVILFLIRKATPGAWVLWT